MSGKNTAAHGRSGRERGAALLTIVWICSLLSLLVLSVTMLGYSAARQDALDARLLRRHAAFEAVTARIILQLTDNRLDHRPRTDGTPFEIETDRGRFRVRVQDERGKIDLNEAPEDLLEGLMESTGLGDEAARELVRAMLEWRDRSGASRAAGVSWTAGPRRSPFLRIDEVKLIPGMSEALFAKIEPAITVHSKRQMFDVQLAPKAALLALSGMTEAEAEAIIAARTASAASPSPLQPPPQGGEVYAIRVEEAEHPARFRQTIVMVTGDPGRPFLTLAWH